MAGMASTSPAVLEMMRQEEARRAAAQPASMAALGSVTATHPMNPTAGPMGQYFSNPGNGTLSAYTPNPEMTTNQYQTGAGGNTEVAGKGSIDPNAYAGQQQTQLEAQLKSSQMDKAAKLQADAEARRLGYLSTVTGQQSPQVPNQAGPASNENAARAAAFARAKEQAGSTALASLKALQDVMASSGKMGSSVEGNMKAAIIGGAGHDINDFTRTQLMQDLNRASEVGDRNYQGQITQRGQNLSLIPSLMGLITQTGGVY